MPVDPAEMTLDGASWRWGLWVAAASFGLVDALKVFAAEFQTLGCAGWGAALVPFDSIGLWSGRALVGDRAGQLAQWRAKPDQKRHGALVKLGLTADTARSCKATHVKPDALVA
jgi:hypothetical protein